jgi:hypothetical protein
MFCRLLTLVLSWSILTTAASADDIYLHRPTGVRLPAVVEGFARSKVTDFESSQPGQGVGVRYEIPSAFVATLYIYTGGVQPAPKTVDHPFVLQERNAAIQALLAQAKTREPLGISALSRLSMSYKWDAATSPKKTPVLVDTFIVYFGGRATNDSTRIWIAKGHLWKLRLTRAPSADDINTVPFITALVQLSVLGDD